MKPVRVVGAGLSGLAAAWYLAKLGAEVEILEASSRAGGLIGTRRESHGLVETAANALLWTDDVRDLFAELAVEPQFPRPESRRRYIVRNGVPRRWPLSPIETAATAARFASRWASGALAPRESESVAAWGRRTLGAAATEHVLGPALQGIYAAPSDQLSAEAIGLGRRKPRPGLAAPMGGMEALIDGLQAALLRRGVRIAFGARLDRIDRDRPTMICTSAPEAERLAGSAGLEPLATALRAVRMLPLVTATAFFEPAPGDVHGFGVLFPRHSARALGVLLNTDTFEHRGPARSETWIYGGGDALGEDHAVLRSAIERDRRVNRIGSGALVALHVTRVAAALPLYDGAIAGVRQACAALPAWLGLCGNYTGAIGASALITRARHEADRVVSA